MEGSDEKYSKLVLLYLRTEVENSLRQFGFHFESRVTIT